MKPGANAGLRIANATCAAVSVLLALAGLAAARATAAAIATLAAGAIDLTQLFGFEITHRSYSPLM